jgi:PAS domain S-box-containing protein
MSKNNLENSSLSTVSIFLDALDSSQNGIVIADMGGKIEYTNPAFLRMFEYDSSQDVLGVTAEKLLQTGRSELLQM